MAITTANQRPDLFNGVILIGPLIQLENLPPAFVVCMNTTVHNVTQ